MNALFSRQGKLGSLCILLLIGLGTWGGDAQAANRYARANGNWNATATWSTTSGGAGGASVPVAGDVVFIGEAGARTVTIPTGYAAAATSVTIGNVPAVNGNSGVTLAAASSSLTTGTVTLYWPGNNSINSLTVNAGTVTVTGNTVFAGTVPTNANRRSRITITTGSMTIGGDLVLATGFAVGNSTILMSGGAGTLNIAGNFTGTAGSYTAPYGTLTPGATSTVNFNGSTVAQTIPIGVSSIVYHNIYVNNTHASGASLSAAITGTNVTGDLQVQGSGILNDNGFRIVSAGGGDVLSVANGATLNLTYSSTCATPTISGYTTTTFGASSNTNYSAGANQCVSADTYGNLTVSGGAGTATLGGATTVAGLLTLAAGDTLADGGFVLTANGGISNAGLHTGAGSITLSGGAAAHALSGNGTYANLILNDANGATLGGSPTLSGTLTLTSGTFAVGANTLTLNGPTIAGTPANLSTTSSSNLVFGGSAAGVLVPSSVGALNNLTINNASGVTLSGNPTLSGTLALTSGTLAVGAHTLTLNGPTIAGTPANLSTTSSSNLVFGGSAAGVLVPSSVGALNNLTVNNASGVTLSGSPNLSGTLTLTNGVITTGANTLITSAACNTPSVAPAPGGWVNGNLRKAIPAGASTCNFEVGDAGNYTPVSTTFVAGTAAGNLTASTVGTQHPSIADPSSGLNTARMVNRYWTLTISSGLGTLGTGYSATFNFINGTPVDLTAGANTANFETERWNGAAWSATTVGTRNPTNTTATGLTSFGAFAVGEKKSTVVSINCSIPCATATSAATVSWAVTFDKSVTGVDATAFSLVPTGLVGAYITSVTGSGTTWTVTANTGIGSGSLGLNQSGAGSVVPTLVGTFTGQVYTTIAISALAEYRMDEASWNGTAGEVVDSSGSGNHAQAFNSANTTDGSRAIAGSPGTCRYGVFDDGTTITQGYVQTPLPNLTTDFTVTAWIRTTNNTVGAQRIFIDDQGTAPATGYGISLGEAGTGKLRFYSRGITPVILDSTYTIANNTWYFVAAVADITNKKRTIYVFDASGAFLDSATEAAWTGGAWGTDGGPVSIGAETNASAETPAANHFKGNIDEVRVYQKVLSQNALTAIATQTHACPVYVPDHLLIQSSGSGLTCAASTLTVAACKDSSCATPFTLGVSGTLSATGTPTVNWDGTTGGAAGAGFVIPNGSSSVTKDMQVATAGTVVFGITGPTPVPTNATTCNFGSPVCTFTANTAGFIYSNTTTGSSYTIPAQVSGIATPTLYLRALQASTTNPAVCTPAIISQTIGVNMGYVCNNPATCQAGNLTTINATPVAPGGTSVTLSFDANASAPITARYDDVGQITLNASKSVTPFGGATAVTLTGSSNAYVVTPHHFDLSGIQQTAAPNLANPAAADATGNKFVKAGEQFSVTVTARNFLNAATPNYGKETSAESVKLTPSLVAPAGGNIPTLGGTFGAFSGGVATGTNFTWNEVGIITLTPSVGDADYLGAGDRSGTASGNVGRFYPDHFSLSAASLANRSGGCAPASSFTYLDEALNLELTLTAHSSGGGTTQNYDGILAGGGFAKLAPGSFSNYSFGARSGTTNLTSRISGTINGTPAWASGVLSAVTASATVAARNATPLPLRDGPWTGTQFGIAPSDSDGTQLLAGALNLDVDNNAVNDHQALGATTELRFGRLHLLNAYGSELLPILLPVRAEYWNSTNWQLNPYDSCTVLTPGALAIGNVTRPTGSALAFSTPPAGVAGSPSPTLTAGVTSLKITPATKGVGTADLVLNLGGAIGLTSCVTLSSPLGGAAPSPTLPYLAGNWCGSADDKAPVARVKFGSPRAPYIYMRERY